MTYTEFVITREQFMDLIEAGIADAPTLSGSDRAKLRAVGLSATEAAVGSYSQGCPLNLACGVDGSGTRLSRGRQDFAYGFDDAVRELQKSDPGIDVPDVLVWKVVVK